MNHESHFHLLKHDPHITFASTRHLILENKSNKPSRGSGQSRVLPTFNLPRTQQVVPSFKNSYKIEQALYKPLIHPYYAKFC